MVKKQKNKNQPDPLPWKQDSGYLQQLEKDITKILQITKQHISKTIVDQL